jgi:hypothetical protein
MQDYVRGTINKVLTHEITTIQKRDEEAASAEVWTPESLCFRWYNTLNEFRASKRVSAPNKLITVRVFRNTSNGGARLSNSKDCPRISSWTG